jgi:LEA14-like dessication related protein
MTRSEIQARVRTLKEELETRHKYGTVKLASPDGKPIPVKDLQEELYSLIYKLSKFE